jgi:hypothetical protein
MTAFFEPPPVDRPLGRASRGLVLLGIVALVAGPSSPWRIQLVAPQYRKADARDASHKIARRERRSGPGRDQHSTTNDRHETDRVGRLRRDDGMPFAIGVFAPSLRAVMGCIGHPSISACCSGLLRRVLLGTFAIGCGATATIRSARADARRAVHAGDRSQIANFVQTSLPMPAGAWLPRRPGARSGSRRRSCDHDRRLLVLPRPRRCFLAPRGRSAGRGRCGADCGRAAPPQARRSTAAAAEWAV